MSKRWQAVDSTVFDLTGRDLNLRPPASETNALTLENVTQQACMLVYCNQRATVRIMKQSRIIVNLLRLHLQWWRHKLSQCRKRFWQMFFSRFRLRQPIEERGSSMLERTSYLNQNNAKVKQKYFKSQTLVSSNVKNTKTENHEGKTCLSRYSVCTIFVEESTRYLALR